MKETLTFIPATVDEMKARGIERPDIVIVSGDAYVDHPAFGTAVMARLAEYCGMNVVVLAQPNWRDDLRDFKKFGKPVYFFGVTAGCMDSMVNHYTARKRIRSEDAYTPGGKAGFRPDYASIEYTRILKKLYPDVPVVLGGIEASLRRLTHYDYWSDSLKTSVLLESGADMILYGMAERAFVTIIKKLQEGMEFDKLKDVPQTVLACNSHFEKLPGDVFLPSHEDCVRKKEVFAAMFAQLEKENSAMIQNRIVQKTGNKQIIVNPHFPPPTAEETDLSFDLPYTRLPHPRYKSKPPIPAFEMIKHSVTIHRGCFGGCAFCAINVHQGKFIASRSEQSVLRELKKIASSEDFRGHITDLGGPSANMYQMKGKDMKQCERCHRPSCLFPEICQNLCYDHHPLLNMYEKAAQTEGVKLITIGSGIRYDMLVERDSKTDKTYGLSKYSKVLIKNHISGRLKVAPEHLTEEVLKIMRKPSFDKFRAFHRVFQKIKDEERMKHELVIYLISNHPGSEDDDMKMLAKVTNAMGYRAETVQDFTPTPMTLSSVIWYTGIHPYTGKTIKSMQYSGRNKTQKDWIVKNKRKKK